MPKRITRAERTADNDERLTRAARAVFVKRGYHGATLDEVARAAGLTKGAVYARFASKADLFLSLFDAHVTARIAQIAQLPAPAGAFTVDDIVRQWLAKSAEDPAWSLLVLEFRVAAARDKAIAARYHAIHERMITAIAARIERGLVATRRALGVEVREAARLGFALQVGAQLERATGASLDTDVVLRANLALYAGLVAPRSA